MNRIIVDMPEIPDEGWFAKHCANVITGGKKELYDVLIRPRSKNV